MESKRKYKNLPLFDLDIDEGMGAIVDKISLVDFPAIERDFLAFSKETPMQFSVNEERREVLGAVMVPNMPIYRRDDSGKEYYVQFNPVVIRKIAQVFFKKGFIDSLNIQHSDKMADAYIFQSFIIDRKSGIKSPESLGELPEGTWVACIKIQSEKLWKDIKDNKFRGFSVEGEFLFKTGFKSNTEKDEVMDLLQELQALLN